MDNGNILPARPSIKQSAIYLNMCEKTVRRMIADGRLKAYRIGGKNTIRVDRDSLLALMRPMSVAA
ncbi:helix-turn-helix domain-containing protein [Mycobacterium sp. PDNC021]|uniref:helix-turn-helix domain-containing protein n=1 Tax=Mycobacterium sp. PDNC021 TaxID=3391399 RepID=UPI003AAFB0C9